MITFGLDRARSELVDLVAGDGVHLPHDARDQLARAADRPGCVKAVGMPDLHAGANCPIGAAFAFLNIVVPSLVGSDIGCGARLVVTRERKARLDAIERRLRDEFSEDAEDDAGPESHPGDLVSPSPFESVRGRAWGIDLDAPQFHRSLGSIGGGNHFAEVTHVSQIVDPRRAEQLGLHSGAISVLVHTGSRGLGKVIADRFADCSHAAAQADYLPLHDFACRYAEHNRRLLARRLLRAIGTRERNTVCAVDCAHNQVVRATWSGLSVWVHRKGAAPAESGRLTVVLGTRGSPSWLLEGTGCERTLSSIAHGAGRRFSRSEAYQKMRAKHSRQSLLRTTVGSRVVCDRTELLYEEHPDAYKPIQPVIDAIVSQGLARPIAAFTPLVTVKQ